MIPKILHQAWVGPKPIPEREKAWCEEMKRMNFGWDVRFYGNEALSTYGMDPYIRALQHLQKPWAFIADRLRMLLLRDYGGLWLDPDCQPIKPLDSLSEIWNSRTTFVAGFRSPRRHEVALHRGVTLVDNTFLASAPNSRMCQRILSLWRPQNVVVDGHAVGVEIIDNKSWDDTLLSHHAFYSMRLTPEVVCLHDPHNLASWVQETKAEQRTKIIA